MDKFEYKIIKGTMHGELNNFGDKVMIKFHEDKLKTELNELGKEGWEAFAISSVNGFSTEIYLKRRISV